MRRKPNPSRRLLLASLAGAAVSARGVLKGATSGNRALVLVRLADPADTVQTFSGSHGDGTLRITSATSQKQFGMHPGLAAVRELYERRSIALIQDTDGSTPGSDWDYVAHGFTAPAWMIKASGSNAVHAFRSGLLMLTPAGSTIPMGQIDNAAALEASGRGNFVFPNTSIGRQLRQVAGLLTASVATRPLFVASLGGAVTVGGPEEQRTGRLRQLGDALASFQDAVSAMGIASNVITFTDTDVRGMVRGGSARVVMGASVLGGEVYGLPGGWRQAEAALADWAGYRIPTPPFSAPGINFLY
jgi:uncharacterized protein (DUF1501 family)